MSLSPQMGEEPFFSFYAAWGKPATYRLLMSVEFIKYSFSLLSDNPEKGRNACGEGAFHQARNRPSPTVTELRKAR
ncbi:hypothetical protein [Stenotrophomonas maltophilia]|uniref:hypothetical protein n=1 Tax=Stenotrophomonas maltophilia TaxID=40324 RepID=UPI0011328535|nr:hypothetical protein [Stenotrophomonas maltophilia]